MNRRAGSGNMCFVLAALTWFGLVGSVTNRPSQRPNIVLILADDLGWNDVGFRNSDMLTPNIDKLAAEGLILNQLYAQPLCSPTRSAIMTGRYPFKTGHQHVVIHNNQAVCASQRDSFLPEELKDLGYATHMVGKWHLGFCSWSCTPIYRGFDSFFGFLGSDEDHFNHLHHGYLDYWNNTDVAFDYDKIYSAETFAEQAVDRIAHHNVEKPLFLYLALHNVHYPIETTDEYVSRYPEINKSGRGVYSGMASAMDDSVGRVVEALKRKGIYEDTIILFLSDNGGSPTFFGNNYPLRGTKGTLWEGGTRVVGVIRGKPLLHTGTVYDGLIHAVDWKATLISAAGSKLDDDSDSIDHWDNMVHGRTTDRSEFVYNIDDVDKGRSNGYAALRYADYKLIQGYPGRYSGWYHPWYDPVNESRDSLKSSMELDDPENTFQLFNLKDDPNETRNLADSEPSLVVKLKLRLQEYQEELVPPLFPEASEEADPRLYEGVWSPGWC